MAASTATEADASPTVGEFTGNHYLATPEIVQTDASIRSLNVLHRGLGGLVSWCADESATGEPLLGIHLTTAESGWALEPLRWERIDRWIPRWRTQTEDLVITGTICMPGGMNPILRGGVLSIELQNRGRTSRSVRVALEGKWRQSLLTIATTRAVAGVNRLVRGALHDGLALEIGSGAHSAALGISAGAGATYRVAPGDEPLADLGAGDELVAANGRLLRFDAARTVDVRPGKQASVAFYFGTAPERDGALATAEYLTMLGAEELIRLGRLDLTRLGRRTRDASIAGMINRNLFFACYAGIARAIDDDRLYFVRSRVPAHGACAVFNEREALLWLLPALTAADPFIAREALIRCFEQYSHRPGERWRYLDGGVLAPGLCLDQFCAYAIALDRYAADARDANILDEPLVQDVLRELDDILFHRLDPEHFLCSTELLPSGERADYPFVAYDNALVWRYAEALPRIWRRRQGETPPRFERAGEEIAAALWQRCTAEVDGMRVIGYASDLRGGVAIYDDPSGSLRLLPSLGFCEADDPIWSNTMDLLHSPVYPLWHGRKPFPGFAGRSRPDRASFAALCSDLLTPRREVALQLVRKLRLDGGIAGELYDPDTGRTVSGAFSAPLAGFLAWALLMESAAATEGSARQKARA